MLGDFSFRQAKPGIEVSVKPRTAQGDDRVVGVLRQRGRSKSAGVPVDMRYAQVFTIRNGKQVRMEMYDDPNDALKAVGLEE